MLPYVVMISMNEKNGNLVFIPTARDKQGLSKATSQIRILESFYESANVGLELWKTLDICISEPNFELEMMGKVHEQVGSLSLGKFVKEYRQVSVTYKPDQNLLIISPMKRHGSKGYVREKSDGSLQVSADVSDIEIGETILTAFKIAK